MRIKKERGKIIHKQRESRKITWWVENRHINRNKRLRERKGKHKQREYRKREER